MFCPFFYIPINFFKLLHNLLHSIKSYQFKVASTEGSCRRTGDETRIKESADVIISPRRNFYLRGWTCEEKSV